MRKRKSITIRKYITWTNLLLVGLLAIVMLLFTAVLSKVAIKYDLSRTMNRKVRQMSREIYVQNGTLHVTDDFEMVDEDQFHYLVLDENGSILYGEYPNGLTESDFPLYTWKNEDNEIVISTYVLHLETIGRQRYYIMDRKDRSVSKELDNTIICRCFIQKHNVASDYQQITYMAYVTAAIILFLMVCFTLLVTRRITQPMQALTKNVEHIGRNQDFSERTNYDGPIKELAALSDAENRMLDGFEEILHAHKQFTSDVSHELRTPLAVIMSQCEYAKDHIDDPAAFNESIDVIYEEAQSTNILVLKLLQLNRLLRGTAALNLEYVNLADMIESICEEMEDTSPKKPQFLYTVENLYAQVDVRLMVIVLKNLIDNAVKYSEKGAVVEINTACERDSIYIKIHDHGCGIPEKSLKKIFSAFYREEKSRSSEGFGLGLPLAERIVVLHGGTLTVESTIGKGSTFTICLPSPD